MTTPARKVYDRAMTAAWKAYKKAEEAALNAQAKALKTYVKSETSTKLKFRRKQNHDSIVFVIETPVDRRNNMSIEFGEEDGQHRCLSLDTFNDIFEPVPKAKQ